MFEYDKKIFFFGLTTFFLLLSYVWREKYFFLNIRLMVILLNQLNIDLKMLACWVTNYSTKLITNLFSYYFKIFELVTDELTKILYFRLS
jgi:hypothetical protein